MTNQNNENLEELAAKFYEAEQAKQMADEIKKGQQILYANPAPQPADSLIADIKSQIAARLPRQKAAARRLVFAGAAAVAAVFVAIAWVGVKLVGRAELGQQPERPIIAMISQEIWQSGNVADDDPDLAILSAEIEEIPIRLLAIRSGEQANGNGSALVEIEMELIEIESNFWKG